MRDPSSASENEADAYPGAPPWVKRSGVVLIGLVVLVVLVVVVLTALGPHTPGGPGGHGF